MLIHLFILSLLFTLINCQGSIPTSVWATGTINGQETVTLSPYTQVFKPLYSTVQTPKTGSVGLGTISGSVGTVRPKMYITVTAGASTSAK